MFYATEHGRPELLARTVLIDPSAFALDTVAPGSVIMVEAGTGAGPGEASLLGSGQAGNLKLILEPDRKPSFAVFEKQQ
jgi:hypothetical protein